MWSQSNLENIPEELVKPLKDTDALVREYLAGLGFIVQDSARDQNFWDRHLLSYMAQEFLESATSIISLAMDGLHRTIRRELRFIIEGSIKLCFVQQKDYSSSIADKLIKFDNELSSQRISINKNIDLSMLPDDLREAFSDETGRLYGLMSDYVHLSPKQIEERIAAVDAGRTAGKESANEIEALP